MSEQFEVNVTHSPDRVDKDGTYTIKNIAGPITGRYGPALVLTVMNSSNQERTLTVPYKEETTDRTNLGRLIQAFGKTKRTWLNRKIRVSIGEDNRRTIEPVTK
jgi:hypothetical protein